MCLMVCQSVSKGPLSCSWFVEKSIEERHYLLVEGVYRPQKLLTSKSAQRQWVEGVKRCYEHVLSQGRDMGTLKTNALNSA
eukprot:07173_6